MTERYLYDGIKSVRIADLPPSAWVQHSPHVNEAEKQAADYYRAVPWLSRGVGIRAQAVSTLPFAIFKGEAEYDVSDDWQNKIEFLPNPDHVLYLVEAALVLMGQAYLHPMRNAVMVKGLKYLLPTSMTPIHDKQTGELLYFERRLASGTVRLEVEDVVWFWPPDPYVELGPASNCPAGAAMQAAGVLYNVDEFAAQFFKRGAIKAQLLTVEGNPSDLEKQKLKAWWQRMFEGVQRAWTTEVISTNVTPVTVGEGVKELSDSELTKEKREDISTALGIPQTLLFSQSANYATAQEDRLSFYVETIVPESRFIQAVLNERLFEPMGLRWSFKPETLDVMQADENQRSQAFKNYADAGVPLGIAAEMLGLELPEGVEYDDLTEAAAARTPPQLQPFTGQQNPPGRQSPPNNQPPPDEQAKADLRRWRVVALKCLKTGDNPGDRAFRSQHIDADTMRTIGAMLDGASTEEEVAAAFAAPFCEALVGGGWEAYP